VRPSSLCASVHEASATRTSAATNEVLMRKRRHEQLERSPTGSIMGPPESSADRATRSRGASRSFRQSSSWHQAPAHSSDSPPTFRSVEARKASAGADPEKHHPKSQHAPDLGSPKTPHLLALPRRNDSSPTCLCATSRHLVRQQGLPWRRRQDRHRRPDAETPWSLAIAKVDAKGFEAESRRKRRAQDRKATAHGAVWPKASHPSELRNRLRETPFDSGPTSPTVRAGDRWNPRVPAVSISPGRPGLGRSPDGAVSGA
jgi:hypothetical protein